MSNDPANENLDKTPAEEHRLPATVEPTKSLLDCKPWLAEIRRQAEIKPREHEKNTGPFYRPDAPYRAKMSLPYESGTTIVIKGRVWSHEDKAPVEATIEVWQADQHGKYDNEEVGQPTDKRVFSNRARVRCDEHGYYEIETIQPGPYTRGSTVHAAHIHFLVSFTGHLDCVTQLLFKGDSNINRDPYRQYSEIVELTEVERNGQKYKEGIFNIVLKASPDAPN